MRTDDLLRLHEETCDKCRNIMAAKNADYCGGSGDPFANFRITEVFGIHPVMGIVIRITDKLQRIRAFVNNGEMAVKAESFGDACDDIINYAVLIKGMLKELEDSTPTKPVFENELEEDECLCGHRMFMQHGRGFICENCDPLIK